MPRRARHGPRAFPTLRVRYGRQHRIYLQGVPLEPRIQAIVDQRGNTVDRYRHQPGILGGVKVKNTQPGQVRPDMPILTLTIYLPFENVFTVGIHALGPLQSLPTQPSTVTSYTARPSTSVTTPAMFSSLWPCGKTKGGEGVAGSVPQPTATIQLTARHPQVFIFLPLSLSGVSRRRRTGWSTRESGCRPRPRHDRTDSPESGGDRGLGSNRRRSLSPHPPLPRGTR